MRFEKQQPKTQGVPLGTVFGVVLVLAAALAAAWLRLGLPLPLCHFREWTGVPCPTCGATRMVQALLSGEIGQALVLNPLLFLGLAGVAAWALIATAVRLFGLPTWRMRFGSREWLVVRLAVVALFLSDWIYLVWHGV
jgi:hypothetical protein